MSTEPMTVLERVTFVLERMRVAGGWDDEEAARQVLATLGLDDDGKPVPDVKGQTSPDV